MAKQCEYRGVGDRAFASCLFEVFSCESSHVETRNSACYRAVLGDLGSTFFGAPVVTLRKIAFYKALEELKWFLHGTSECPSGLRDTWWRGQLNPEGHYLGGYGDQIQRFGSGFNQIEHIVAGLKSSPNSRRLCLTTWNPEQMASITEINQNPKTPTTCHLSFVQFQIDRGKLHMVAYQRSGDLLLGVPHNWVQLWCLGLWIAARVGVPLGRVKWTGGDIHVYDHPSHLSVAQAILKHWNDNHVLIREAACEIVYTPTNVDVFEPRDFEIVFKDSWDNVIETPQPVTLEIPALL